MRNPTYYFGNKPNKKMSGFSSPCGGFRTRPTRTYGGKNDAEIIFVTIRYNFLPGGMSAPGKACFKLAGSSRNMDSPLLVVMGWACRRRNPFDMGVQSNQGEMILNY